MSNKIFLVDHDPDQITMVKTRLEANGFEVYSSSNVEENIDSISKEKPDAILLDVAYPDLKGFEMCKDIKSNSKLKDVPVVLFTAYTAKDFDEKIAYSKADAVISKPYDSQDLVAKLKTTILKK